MTLLPLFHSSCSTQRSEIPLGLETCSASARLPPPGQPEAVGQTLCLERGAVGISTSRSPLAHRCCFTGEPGTGNRRRSHYVASCFGDPRRPSILDVRSTTTARIFSRFDSVAYFHAAHRRLTIAAPIPTSKKLAVRQKRRYGGHPSDIQAGPLRRRAHRRSR